MAEQKGKIFSRDIVKEMRESYLDYAMSVIVSRALPDVRDGLKPVHRRILYTMHEMGLTSGSKHRKSAAITGDVMGKYHPHGDTAIYDSLVRMAQPWAMRYPLVDGQGNYGNIDGDSAAAMRYCVTGNTLILTNKGVLPIKNLSDGKEKEENIKIKILSKDGKINEANKWFDSGGHPTIKITTGYGYNLQGSQNHPVLIWGINSFTARPEFQWKLLSKIKIGDTAVIDRSADILWPEKNLSLKSFEPQNANPRIQIKSLPPKLDKNLAFILGALVSEGTIKNKELEFCNSDTDFIEEFEKRWKKVFPDCRLHKFVHRPNSFGKKPYQTLEIHSQYVIEFLRNIGLSPVKSNKKTIPHTIFMSPKPVVASFLAAYFEGDGSISSSKKMVELSCISKSEQLLDQVQILLLRYGIACAKRFDTYRNIHKLYIRGVRNYHLFSNEIGFLSKRKKSKLEYVLRVFTKDYSATDFVPFIQNFARHHLSANACYAGREFVAKHNFDRYSNMQENYKSISALLHQEVKIDITGLFENILTNNYLFDPITKIEAGETQEVYSIRVDSQCHSFVGNGFINHNTEARMSPISAEILRDIEKDTVDFQPTYDATRQEPKLLPSAIPQLLLNGSLGIAVGMATNIPPHNLSEVIDATKHLINKPKSTTEDLVQFIQGPDFPTGGLIFNKDEIHQAYATGRGGVVNRGEAEIVEKKAGQYQIVITSIPYQVNKAELIIKVADLVREKKIDGIRDIRDESDKEGLRVVIELKQDAFAQKVLNNLYKHTDLERTFHFNMLALVDGIQPQILSLKSILEKFIEHRQVVVERRTRFDLKKAEERAHILEGLKKALDHIDAVIKIIKSSADRDTAKKNLVKKFSLSERQVDAILDMRLATLANLERQKITDELKEKLRLIRDLKALLKDPKKILETIKTELEEIKKKYGDERKTKVVAGAIKSFKAEDLIPEAEQVMVLTKGGYVKRVNPEEYRLQKRGGKGLIGAEVKEEDVVSVFLSANTHDDLLFFSSLGKVYQTKMYDVPEGKRISKGKSILNVLPLTQEEEITSVLPVPKTKKGEKVFLVMITAFGIIKKVEPSHFENVRRSGIIAIKLQKGDSLYWVRLAAKGDHIVLATKLGKAIRFKESDIRPMGRNAAGVRAMRVSGKDKLIGADVIAGAEKNAHLLVMSSGGFGKKTNIKNYRLQRRGGAGIKTAKVTEKTGPLVSAKVIYPDFEELIAISKKGQVIRTPLSSVPEHGRDTQGVRMMKLQTKDAIASLTCL